MKIIKNGSFTKEEVMNGLRLAREEGIENLTMESHMFEGYKQNMVLELN